MQRQAEWKRRSRPAAPGAIALARDDAKWKTGQTLARLAR
jgi:hypothetical protein